MTRNDEKEKLDLDEGSVNREQADCHKEAWPKKENHLVLQEWKLEYTCISPPHQMLQAAVDPSSIYCLK